MRGGSARAVRPARSDSPHADRDEPHAHPAGAGRRAAVVNEIRKFELFTDGRAAQVPLDRPDLIIERSRLIRGLAEERKVTARKFLSATASWICKATEMDCA